MVLHSYNPNTQEAETGELHVQGQPEPKVMGLSLTHTHTQLVLFGAFAGL